MQLLGDAHGKVEADCCGEPENALIKLQRDESELEVAVKRYHWEGDCAPQDVVHRAIKSGKIRDWDELRQARNKKVALRQFGPFVEAIRSLVQSFQYLEDRIGSKQYEGK